MEKTSLIELQEDVADLRLTAPKFIEEAYKKENARKINLLVKTKYVTKVEEYSVPQINNPFDSCNIEELTVNMDLLEEMLKRQLAMIQVLCRGSLDNIKLDD